MPTAKIIINNLQGGLNTDNPPHLLQPNELALNTDNLYRSGKWKKRSGFTLPFTATGDANNIIEIDDYIRLDGTTHLVAATTDRLYLLNGTTWDEKKNLATTRTDADKWYFTEIGDMLYATNGVDPIQQVGDISSGSFSDVSWDTAGGSKDITSAKVILAFNSRLLLFNTDDTTDGAVPNRIQWTDVLDFDKVSTTNFNDLNYSQAPILGARILNRSFIAVYKSDSVALVQDRGDPLFFVPVFAEPIGIISRKAHAPFPQGNFFVSNAGFYLLLNGGIRPLGDDVITTGFFDELDPEKQDHVYCYTDWKNREVVTLYPSTSASGNEPDRALVYNWAFDNWAKWEFDAFCGFYQFRTVDTPVTYLGTSSGNVKKLGAPGAGATDNGTAITNKLRTKSFFNAPNPNNPNPNDYITIKRVETDTRPVGATVKVGHQDYGTESPDFATKGTSGTITDNDGQAPFVDTAPVYTRYFAVEFESFDELSELTIHLEDAGGE